MNVNLRRINNEVFVADEPIVRLGAEHLAFLKQQALSSERKRARICTHRSNEDPLHEMLLAICANSYIHPHKHNKKVESFYIIEGLVDVVLFNDMGSIIDVVELGGLATGKNFYYRLSDSLFHTLLIHTDFLVLHEVTNGPFVQNETILAPFAPQENQVKEVHAYVNNLCLTLVPQHLNKQQRNTK